MPKFPGDTVLTETSVNSRHLNILHFTCVSFRDHLDKLVPEQQTVQHSSTTKHSNIFLQAECPSCHTSATGVKH